MAIHTTPKYHFPSQKEVEHYLNYHETTYQFQEYGINRRVAEVFSHRCLELIDIHRKLIKGLSDMFEERFMAEDRQAQICKALAKALEGWRMP